jgi:hypothetical protein
MTLGILGNSARPIARLPSMRGTPPLLALPSMRGYAGLGATVPANCWDKPGFKDCNAQAWKVAETRCITQGLAEKSYGGDWVKCKEVQANDYAYYGCALRICPPPVQPAPKTVGGWTWASPTPNPGILAFQNHINACLTRNGFKPIVADGRIGPATCGAFKTIGGICPENFATDPVANIAVCASWLNPTKVGESQPVKDPHSAEAQELDAKFGGLPWMVRDNRVPNLQEGLNQQLTGHEFLPVPTSGMLDATMCGGMRWLDVNTGSRWMPSWGQKCQAFTDPKRRAAPGPSGPSGPSGPTGPTGPAAPRAPVPAPAPAKTSNAMMIAGGLLAAVAVGGYAWYKSKTGGA